MIIFNKFNSNKFKKFKGKSPKNFNKKVKIKRMEMVIIELKKVEEGIIPIYENNSKEKLISARELFYALRGEKTKTKFADWIKERLIKYKFEENIDYIGFSLKNEKPSGGRPVKEFYLLMDTAKEVCMIENNDKGRKIRKYFIEVEKRYREIINVNNSSNQLIDIMQNAINYMRENNIRVDNLEIGLNEVKEDIKDLKSKIDVKIQNNYCLASDIAGQLKLYSENKIPHSNLIGAIARQLGYKISYKHYYEDEYIAIIKDVSKNEYWQVYFKQKAVQEIIEWFNNNKEDIYYEIQYVRNTKNGKKGEIKERGYKIEEIYYKIIL